MLLKLDWIRSVNHFKIQDPCRIWTKLMQKKCGIFVAKRLDFSYFWTSFRLGFFIWKKFWTVVELELSFKKSRLDPDRKTWRYADLCYIDSCSWKVTSGPVSHKILTPQLLLIARVRDYVFARTGRSHFFRLQLHSCSKIFEYGFASGSENSSILRIRLLFRLHYNRCNRKVSMVLLKKWPRRLLLLPKLKSDSGFESWFSKNFESDSGSERKVQNRHTGSVATSGDCILVVTTAVPWYVSFHSSPCVVWW